MLSSVSCLWYCKSTIFQANHNRRNNQLRHRLAVCDTAKVRFFKQITTKRLRKLIDNELFVILQKYDFSSKSQLALCTSLTLSCCLWYCKSTIFQANHNWICSAMVGLVAVCDTAKVRFFKQITTVQRQISWIYCCLWYCKSAIFQANHNWLSLPPYREWLCAWPAPPAVGRRRWCRLFVWRSLFFLIKCLVSWFYFVSSH